MPPLPLAQSIALGIDPHIRALVAAFSQDTPLPDTEPTSVTPSLIRHQPHPSLPGARHIISISGSDSDSDDETPGPRLPTPKPKPHKATQTAAPDLSSDDSERQYRSADQEEHRAKMEERRAGKKPEQGFGDASGSVASPRKVSFGDLDLDAIMARICLDGDDNIVYAPPSPSRLPPPSTPTRVKPSTSAHANPSTSAPTNPSPSTPTNPLTSARANPLTSTRSNPAGNPKSYQVSSPSCTGNVPTWPLAGHLTQGVLGAHVHRAADEIPVRTGPRRPRKPRSAAYVIFQGLQIGVFDHWRDVEPHINVSGKIFEGYSTRIQAERAWLLGNTVGAVRRLDAARVALATPAAPYTEDVMYYFLGLPEDYLGTEWHVVSKGKRPGVYPCWNLAASQVVHVSGAIYDKYPSKADAVAAFLRAQADGAVHTLP